MELREALLQISEIRRQVAAAEKFHGYRAVPVGCGALLAVAGAAWQSCCVVDPAGNLSGYVACWISVAAVAAALPAVDVFLANRQAGQLRTALAQLAFEQFAPCVVAGALLTWVVAYRVPQIAWTLPGLWSILFSLGMFASWQLMPRPFLLVPIWYLVCGCLLLARGEPHALTPWTMGVAFGVGQALCAGVLACQRPEALDE